LRWFFCQADLIRVQDAVLREFRFGVFENDGKKWAAREDDTIVALKCQGANAMDMSRSMGRSPAAVATRLSYLVGIRRLFVNIDGVVVGTLDGQETEGYFVGTAER
jgi:hypothetical protein